MKVAGVYADKEHLLTPEVMEALAGGVEDQERARRLINTDGPQDWSPRIKEFIARWQDLGYHGTGLLVSGMVHPRHMQDPKQATWFLKAHEMHRALHELPGKDADLQHRSD